jgi:hypothetical protein
MSSVVASNEKRREVRTKRKEFVLRWTLERLSEEEAAPSPDRDRTVMLLRKAARVLRDLDRKDEAEEYRERANQLDSWVAAPSGPPQANGLEDGEP